MDRRTERLKHKKRNNKARLTCFSLQAKLYELSAVSAGKDDIKQIIADNTLRIGPKILFLDEIHRFNKAQQDFLLPYVERGDIVLNELIDEEMKKIIARTKIKIDAKSRDWLIKMANGDARQTISVLENAVQLYKEINLENLKNTVQNKFLRFDKKGDEHYNTISAFIKSMRASQPNAALYYLARMIDAGEDPKFIARRMIIFASEDIGLALPTALVVANDIFRAVETVGFPEAAINLAHGAAYLARAPKDRSSYNAYLEAMEDVKKFGSLPIPMEVRNAPTKLMKDLGYHKGYEMYTEKDYLPEKLKGKKYLKNK